MEEPVQRFTNQMYLPSSSFCVLYDTHPQHIKLHWHEFYEIHYIESGEGVHILNGIAYPLQRGSLFLLTPVDFHEILPSDGHPLTIINVIFCDDMIRDEIRQLLFSDSHPLVTCLNGDRRLSLEMDFQRLWKEFTMRGPGYEAVLKCTFERILIDLARICKFENRAYYTQSKITSHGGIRKALMFMHHNFRSRLSLQDVAKQAQFSSNYFSECFHKVTGLSFQKYLQELRLQFARSLLLVSDCSITEICYASGFNTISHFERVFKERFNEPPGAYRRKNISGQSNRTNCNNDNLNNDKGKSFRMASPGRYCEQIEQLGGRN